MAPPAWNAARRSALVVTLLAGARLASAAPPTFHAEPAVEVIALAVNGTGSGTIVLHNDTAATITAAAITAEPGCDAAVHASPLTGFSLPAGMTRTLAISCTPAPASMQRCSYQVRSAIGAALLGFEAVCAYAGAPTLVPDRTSVDLGAVAIGRSVAQTITLHNTGATALDHLFVEATDLADNFAVGAPCNPDARACDAAIPVVPAGGTTQLIVRCTPHTTGPQAAELHIATSAGSRLAAPITLACSGVAATAPVLVASPTAIDVGAVEVFGASARATVHLSSAGLGIVRLLDVQIVDAGTGGAADWAVTPQLACTAGIPPGCDLAPGGAVDLALVFDPSGIGVRDASLLVNYRDTADRSLSLPLHGSGLGATLELIGDDTTLDLGALPLDTTGTLTFQVTNNGNRDLTDATRTLTAPATGFVVTPGPSFAVAAGAMTTITVSCTPTAKGPLSSILRLDALDVQSAAIDLGLRCTGDPSAPLVATPPALLLGEVRVATQVVKHLAIAGVAGPTQLTSAGLETASPSLTVTGAPATTPAIIDVTAAPTLEGPLANRVLVASSAGATLAVPVSGTAVTATYSVPAVVSLGTFCVEQPTTPRILPLTSTGSATLALAAPRLALADSPFDLQLVAPQRYPVLLASSARATVAVTPKRQATAGLDTDELIWTTDVAGAVTSRTKLTATFVDNGGAIAPPALVFGPTLVHLDTHNAQQVTLQNCDVSALSLDTPQIAAPFSIDSPNFPTGLRPGETATFSVGFHPTKLGPVSRTLVITSPQLRDLQLTVALSGEGSTTGSADSDAGPTSTERGPTSFYACGGCASRDPAGAASWAIVVVCVLAPRRRRGRRRI